MLTSLCRWLEGCRTHLASAPELFKLIKLKLFTAKQLTEFVEEKAYFTQEPRCYMHYLEIHKCHSLGTDLEEYEREHDDANLLLEDYCHDWPSIQANRYVDPGNVREVSAVQVLQRGILKNGEK